MSNGIAKLWKLVVNVCDLSEGERFWSALTGLSAKTYIQSASRKMGVSHRAEAVVWAMQHGFAPPSPPPDDGGS